jgi:hypothetical protein
VILQKPEKFGFNFVRPYNKYFGHLDEGFRKKNRIPDNRIFVVVANFCEDFMNLKLKLKFKRLLRQRKREFSYKSIYVILLSFSPKSLI